MIKGFKFQIRYADTGNADAFLRHLPGYPSYICFHENFKGDTEAVLDLIVYLMEVEKELFPPQKQTVKSVLYVGEGGRVSKLVGNTEVLPVRTALKPAQAKTPTLVEFCRN